MAEEERMNKRIKVQVGSNLSIAFNSSSENDPSNQNPDFIDATPNTLAELCDRSYLLRQRRGKRDSSGDIFPKSLLQGKSKPNTAKDSTSNNNPSTNTPKQNIQNNRKEIQTGPQVEMIDGKIVIKESSLVINGPDAIIQEGEYEEVEEGIHVSSRYSSFTNRRHPRVWGIEETRVFYTVLRQCGTDFSMMQTFFPNRTRKELKLKFYREEKAHPNLVKAALETSLPLDLAPFEIQLGSDLQQEVRKINQRKLDAAAALVEDGTENPKRGKNDNEQELQR